MFTLLERELKVWTFATVPFVPVFAVRIVQIPPGFAEDGTGYVLPERPYTSEKSLVLPEKMVPERSFFPAVPSGVAFVKILLSAEI